MNSNATSAALAFAALRGMEPHAALWGSSRSAHASSLMWLFFAAYIIVGLVFAALSAQAAVNRGLNPLTWFIAGLTLNAVGYLLLLLQRGQPPSAGQSARGLERAAITYAPLPCPACGALNHPAASQCIDCGARLEPQVVSEVAKSKR